MVHPQGESVVRDHTRHCKQALGLERPEIRALPEHQPAQIGLRQGHRIIGPIPHAVAGKSEIEGEFREPDEPGGSIFTASSSASSRTSAATGSSPASTAPPKQPQWSGRKCPGWSPAAASRSARRQAGAAPPLPRRAAAAPASRGMRRKGWSRSGPRGAHQARITKSVDSVLSCGRYLRPHATMSRRPSSQPTCGSQPTSRLIAELSSQ
jgi:hypothetical protein